MKIWAWVFLPVCFTLQSSTPARAQTPAAPQAADAGETYIIDTMTRTYTYAADGTGVREIVGVIDIRSEAAVKQFSVIDLPFASSSEHVEIGYVRVRHSDGSLAETSADSAQQLPAPVTREAPFYSDLKQEQIPVRSLRQGDHLEYDIRFVRTRAEAPGHFWGVERFFTPTSGVVIHDEKVELHFPKAAYVQVWSPDRTFNHTETATESVYRWQSVQLAPVAGKEKSALQKLEHGPIPDDYEPQLPHVAWTNFHTWAEVGAWYRGMEGSRVDPDDEVRSKVASVVLGKSTSDEKARAIYGFVGPDVRYIGVAFGIGRYQPHEAGDVLRNQYGDCKDKATLLSSMLSVAAVPSDAVLIGPGIAFNEAVPSPASFNHLITLAHVDGKPVWLDSTAEVAPYRFLMPTVRGKRALVVPLTGEAHLETTPDTLPFTPEDSFTAAGSLDETGTSHSHMVLTLRGDSEVAFRQAVRSVSAAQWDQLMQQISQGMSYAGKVSHTEFSQPADTTNPFHIEYDYEREKNGDWDNLRILPQLPPVGLGDVDEKDPPLTPIQLGSPHTEIAHAVMTLPKGWYADLPPSIHTHTFFATLDKTYTFANGVITTDRRYTILQKAVPAAQWKEYHQWFKDSGLDGEPYIQLVAANSKTTAPKISESSGDPAAATLMHDAGQAFLRKDFAAAAEKLDQAKAINPRQFGLWASYGTLAVQYGKTNEALDDFRREVDLHPDELPAYRLLANVQAMQGKNDDAIATLRACTLRSPADEVCVLALVGFLNRRADYAASEKVLRTALVTTPGDALLQMNLGLVLLRQNQKPEGEALLLKVLNSTDDPGQLNDTAYELADASLDIDLAEKASRRSLDLLDAASSKGETGIAALRRTSLIVAAWDTLGWILFREGKVDDAEPWIRAAWRNSLSAETGYHLGVILQKQHHPAEALAQLQLARIGSTGANAVETKKLIDSSIADLSSSAGAKHMAQPSTFQEERTYKLARGSVVASGQGWATVEMAVTAQAITSVRILDGDDSLQPLTDAMQHLDLNLAFPASSHATLLRRGVLSCHTNPTCELVLLTTSAAVTQ